MWKRCLAVAIGLAAAVPAGAAGAPFGAHDPAFSDDGWALLTGGRSNETRFHALLRLPDGGYLSGGTTKRDGEGLMVLVRQDAQGKVVTSFGDQGARSVAVGNGRSAAIRALARQPDGRIVAAGWAEHGGERRFALARFTADGQLDPGFGEGGTVMTAVGEDGTASGEAVAVRADGKILAAGSARDGAATKFALARYGPDGRPDAAFAEGGTRTYAIDAALSAAAQEVRFEPGGGATVLGTARFGTLGPGGDVQGAALRVRADGTRDPSFGTRGLARAGVTGRPSNFGAFGWDAQGRILLAGVSRKTTDPPLFETWLDFARLTPTGAPDATLGGDGLRETEYTGDDDVSSLSRLAALDDGRVVATGRGVVGSSPVLSAVASVMWTPGGEVDTAYDEDGALTFQLGAGETYVDADAPGGVVGDGAAVVFNGTAARSLLGGTGEEDHLGAIKRFSLTGFPTSGWGSRIGVHETPRTSAGDAVTLADGSVVVAGRAAFDGIFRPAVWKLTPGGAPDTGFGTGGVVVLEQTGYGGFLASVAVGPGGDLWVAGGVLDEDFKNRMLVARLNADGAPDAAFDGDGVRFVQVSGPPHAPPVCSGSPQLCRDDDGVNASDAAAARHVLPLADGDAVLVGYAGTQGFWDATVPRRLALARVNGDGTLDTAFGTGGVVQLHRNDFPLRRSLPVGAVHDGAGIVVGAEMTDDADAQTGPLTLLRFVPATGALDPAFDGDGAALHPWPAAGRSSAMLRLADGTYRYAGEQDPGDPVFLAKVGAGGVLQTGHGSGGFVDLDPLFPAARPLAPGGAELVELPGGRIVGAAVLRQTPAVAVPPTTFAVDQAGAAVGDFGTAGVLATARSCGRYTTAALAADAAGRLLVVANGTDPEVGATIGLSRHVGGAPSAAILCPPQGSVFVAGSGPYTCSPSFTGSPPITYTYQWIRERTVIAGATAQQYTATAADAGHLLACRVVAANPHSTRRVTSSAVRVPGTPFVEPDGPPGTDPGGGPSTPPGAGDGGGGGAGAPPRPAAPPVPSSAPRPSSPAARKVALVSGWPSTRACVSRRRFRIRLRAPAGTRLVSGTVSVNGRRVRAVRGRRLTAPIDLRDLPRGRFAVKVVARTADGRTLTETRRYRTCTRKRRAR